MKINKSCKAGESADVILDGKHLAFCVEADDKEGYVWVGKTDSNGELLTIENAQAGDFIYDGAVIEKLTGKVKISVREMTKVDAEADAYYHCKPVQPTQIN